MTERLECLYPEYIELHERLYAITQRENIRIIEGLPVQIESGWLLSLELTLRSGNATALMLFSTEPRVHDFLANEPNPSNEKVTFPSVPDMIEEFRRNGCEWILLNESPRIKNGLLIRKDRFIADLERRLGAGNRGSS